MDCCLQSTVEDKRLISYRLVYIFMINIHRRSELAKWDCLSVNFEAILMTHMLLIAARPKKVRYNQIRLLCRIASRETSA